MAEQTVDGLGELTSPAVNDEIGIWDVSAGQYLKIRRDTLVGGTLVGGGTVATGGYTLTVPATGTAALREVANTFTAEITATRYGLQSYTMAVDEVVNFGYRIGLMLVFNGNTGSQSLFFASIATAQVALQGANLSVTKDTALHLNCYVESGALKLQNKTGVSAPIYYGFLAG
jgi:hypothetical protein